MGGNSHNIGLKLNEVGILIIWMRFKTVITYSLKKYFVDQIRIRKFPNDFFSLFFNEMLGPPSTVTDIYVNQSNANCDWIHQSYLL